MLELTNHLEITLLRKFVVVTCLRGKFGINLPSSLF